jgi:hypothetical protein
MAANKYQFTTIWRIPGSAAEVAHVIADNVSDLPRWWPSVYLAAEELEPGEASGVGKVLRLHTKGWLPYTLRWQFTVTEVEYERRFVLEAKGDFVGRGVWTFEQHGPTAMVTYDWQVRAEKPLLRWLSPLIKPVFAANHRWAMRQGLRSLEVELARRHATTADELRRIPPPPGPTGLRDLVGPTLLLTLLGSLAWRRARGGRGRN